MGANEGKPNISFLMERNLPKRINSFLGDIGRLASEIGIGAYAVGGLPRDLLLGRRSFDIDVVVESDGVDFARKFVSKHGGSFKPFDRFGTAILSFRDGLKADVATARRERYPNPGSLPEVEPGDIWWDLYRRDFTINSLAVFVNPDRYGELLDFFGGREDIELKAIRVLHDLSFIDDPTRILRGVRFEGRYGFRMDRKTLRLLKSALATGSLDTVSTERIRGELKLILEEDFPLRSVRKLEKLGILQALHPEWKLTQRAVVAFRGAFRALKLLKDVRPDLRVRGWMIYLVLLLDGLDRDEKAGLSEKLKFQKIAKDRIFEIDSLKAKLIEGLSMPGRMHLGRIYAVLGEISPEAAISLLALSEKAVIRKRIWRYILNIGKFKLEISGEDLMAIGVPPGPILGEILDQILCHKLGWRIFSREKELACARKLWKKFSREVSAL